MKTQYLYLFIGLFLFASCKNNDNQPSEKVSFEIYKTLSFNEVPKEILGKLTQRNVELNTDTLSPIIAYAKGDSTLYLSEIENNQVKFLQTAQPVDGAKAYFAIVATEKQSSLNSIDVKKAKANQNSVSLYFNLKGANKWADLTKNNIGKWVVFVIDGKVYALTKVNGEIRNGVAMLNGFENADEAIRISKSLNASLAN